MQVHIKLFAIYREKAGTSHLEAELPSGATVRDVVRWLHQRFPALAALGDPAMVALNREYVDLDAPVAEGDEVALIPPVSGGGMFTITREPLDSEALTRAVRKDTNGAVVTFLGTTRSFTEGRQVLYLEYEAYPEMAREWLERIAREMREQFTVEDVAMAHRMGRLEIGEVSLVVAVASPHRAEAFRACSYAVDRIKQVVPIWKKEVFADGEVWVGWQYEKVHR